MVRQQGEDNDRVCVVQGSMSGAGATSTHSPIPLILLLLYYKTLLAVSGYMDIAAVDRFHGLSSSSYSSTMLCWW